MTTNDHDGHTIDVGPVTVGTILPADNSKSSARKFTIEVEVRETFRVVPIYPPNRSVDIPVRVRQLLGRLSSYEQAVEAGTMLLALTECEGFSIEKSYRRAEEVLVDGQPLQVSGELTGEVVTHDEFIRRLSQSGSNFPDSLNERARVMEGRTR